MAQPMQQQPVHIHDLAEVCEESAQPCCRDSTVVEVPSRVFGTLRISRCAGRGGLCGELFVHQIITGRELPLHVLGHQDPVLADICWNGYRLALRQEGRHNEVISAGGAAPVIIDL